MKRKYRRFLYHGDEIELSSTSVTYESKKTLSCTIHSFLDRPTKLVVAVSMKVADKAYLGTLGVFVHGAADPSLELTTQSEDYGLQVGSINPGGWAEGLHALELKLKTALGGIVYNQVFEVYYEIPNN